MTVRTPFKIANRKVFSSVKNLFSHRASTAYAHRLPPALLCSIFQHCAPTLENESIAFSQASRSWRGAAFAMKAAIRGYGGYLQFLTCLATDPISHFPSVKHLSLEHACLPASCAMIGSSEKVTGARYLAKVLWTLKVHNRPISEVTLRACIFDTPEIQQFVTFGLSKYLIFIGTRKNSLQKCRKAG